MEENIGRFHVGQIRGIPIGSGTPAEPGLVSRCKCIRIEPHHGRQIQNLIAHCRDGYRLIIDLLPSRIVQTDIQVNIECVRGVHVIRHGYDRPREDPQVFPAVLVVVGSVGIFGVGIGGGTGIGQRGGYPVDVLIHRDRIGGVIHRGG